ncbi:hypothetical protein BC938DRAFT_474179 [Jimgerdemannia flammicorona]|uniref:THIF-type NAD/FAD binding fold domain-containing protein n=1 Tax=Jimgerdemannia flammicorona TaxID=994334 RepID=A0A433Q2S0_9FUNG|nr:hypothetical protein BC938DRAFT_474179 [Jimgerdemannia flammicorona]
MSCSLTDLSKPPQGAQRRHGVQEPGIGGQAHEEGGGVREPRRVIAARLFRAISVSVLTTPPPHPFSSAIPLRHTVLWKFQDTHARLPNPSSAEDLAALRDLRDTHLKSVGVVDPSVVSDDLVDLLALTAHAELAPVCAIVGGVLAQDVLKVLSGKELPVQNWFLYNGLDGRFVVVRGSGVRTVFWGGESKREGWRNRAHHRLFVPISRSRVGSGLIHQIEAGKAL